MRDKVDPQKVEHFFEMLGRRADQHARVYLTGGSTAVLKGWRPQTLDLDVRFEPDHGELFSALPEIKRTLSMNVELASPQDFIPELPGWRRRSEFIAKIGPLEFYHYDFYSQALSKIERGHETDVADVRAFFNSGLVDPDELLRFFTEIESELVRYPAIDPSVFRRKVEDAVTRAKREGWGQSS